MRFLQGSVAIAVSVQTEVDIATRGAECASNQERSASFQH